MNILTVKLHPKNENQIITILTRLDEKYINLSINTTNVDKYNEAINLFKDMKEFLIKLKEILSSVQPTIE